MRSKICQEVEWRDRGREIYGGNYRAREKYFCENEKTLK